MYQPKSPFGSSKSEARFGCRALERKLVRSISKGQRCGCETRRVATDLVKGGVVVVVVVRRRMELKVLKVVVVVVVVVGGGEEGDMERLFSHIMMFT